MFLNMDQLEKQLNKEEFQMIRSMTTFRVLKTHFQKLIKPRISLNDEDGIMARKYLLEYTKLEARVDNRGRIDKCKALDASLVDTEASGKESGKQDTSSRSRNDANIKPIYDDEPMVEVQTTAEINVFATRKQHTKQPEFNNKGEVDHNVKQCNDKRPLLAKLNDNQITKLSYQSLKSKNICLKKTIAQFQKDILRMESHCVNLELKYQNKALKEGQHGQFSKVKSNEAKVKHDINVIETINIELEHKVAKLLKENETLKKHYKELYDSIKTTRAKTIE
ncbi:hypothetical protein Tco_0360710 [Tanacetum coccineum]